MLYSSVYNLFALIGRKAPFTHYKNNVIICQCTGNKTTFDKDMTWECYFNFKYKN